MVKTEEKPIRVRIAPSPTGPFHVGTARTALFNWLFARQNNGTFILRIEDTDAERSKKEYEKEIFNGLNWLGLKWDEGPIVDAQVKSEKLKVKSYFGKYGPYRQSERLEIYKKYLEKLLEEGSAYYCYCTKEELEAEREAMLAQGLPPKYSGHCRNLKEPPSSNKQPQVIRFKTPEVQIEFKDIVRGKVSFDASLFGDLAIAKNLESPLYNFAAVIDDEEMKISHVIRGEDHLSNTPKQILVQKALGFGTPEYAHLPLILNPDRSKMSKRFADTALVEYETKGYLPEAVINFLALLGWHPQTEKEIFSLSELVKEFNLKRVQKAGAVFSQEKLDWVQKEHLKNLTEDEMVDRLAIILKEKRISVTKKFLIKVISVERARLKTLTEFFDIAGFFFKLPDYEPNLLVWQKEQASKIKNNLKEVLGIVKKLPPEEFNKDRLFRTLKDVIEKEGRGQVLWPLRVALSGQAASPDPIEIMCILDKDEIEKRIKIAIDKI